MEMRLFFQTLVLVLFSVLCLRFARGSKPTRFGDTPSNLRLEPISVVRYHLEGNLIPQHESDPKKYNEELYLGFRHGRFLPGTSGPNGQPRPEDGHPPNGPDGERHPPRGEGEPDDLEEESLIGEGDHRRSRGNSSWAWWEFALILVVLAMFVGICICVMLSKKKERGNSSGPRNEGLRSSLPQATGVPEKATAVGIPVTVGMVQIQDPSSKQQAVV